jgi:hypothetical protein
LNWRRSRLRAGARHRRMRRSQPLASHPGDLLRGVARGGGLCAGHNREADRGNGRASGSSGHELPQLVEAAVIRRLRQARSEVTTVRGRSRASTRAIQAATSPSAPIPTPPKPSDRMRVSAAAMTCSRPGHLGDHPTGARPPAHGPVRTGHRAKRKRRSCGAETTGFFPSEATAPPATGRPFGPMSDRKKQLPGAGVVEGPVAGWVTGLVSGVRGLGGGGGEGNLVPSLPAPAQ